MANTKVKIGTVKLSDIQDKYIVIDPFSSSADSLQIQSLADRWQYEGLYHVSTAKEQNGAPAVYGFYLDSKLGQYVENDYPIAWLDQVNKLDHYDENHKPVYVQVPGIKFSNRNGVSNPYHNIIAEKQIGIAKDAGDEDKGHSQAIALIQAVIDYLQHMQFVEWDVYLPNEVEVLDDIVTVGSVTTTSTTTVKPTTTTTTTVQPTTTSTTSTTRNTK